MTDPSTVFPPGFFERDDVTPDSELYRPPRLITHIDDRAIAAVGALYTELGLDGELVRDYPGITNSAVAGRMHGSTPTLPSFPCSWLL